MKVGLKWIELQRKVSHIYDRNTCSISNRPSTLNTGKYISLINMTVKKTTAILIRALDMGA